MVDLSLTGLKLIAKIRGIKGYERMSISSPVRYSLGSILPDDKADIFAVSLLMSYCSFSSLI